MHCLVDFRNRPQNKYSFRTQNEAKECLKKIRNNPLGVTVIYADGRREYFEEGLPKGFFSLSGKAVRIKKGCHVKYRVRKINNFDGLLGTKKQKESRNIANWQRKSVLSLFMLGNRRFYACLSMVAVLAFGASFFFQSRFGQGAAAEFAGEPEIQGQVAGAMDSRAGDDQDADSFLQIADEDIIMNLLGKVEEKQHSEFQKELLGYIKGKPMEAMAPYIAKQPRIVAAFLVGIAMKESKFGLYAPHSGGRDCLNYWGFKGGGTTTSGGYTCFSTPEEAIQVVGKRISKLVDGGRTNPSAMVVWKCGSTCSWDNPENVRKWIADVGVNFYKINSKENS